MKKLFVMLAFAGLVGTVSASVSGTPGDDKKDKNKKEASQKKEGEAKACCKKDAKAEDGKACSGEKKEGKACCKKDAKTSSTTEEKK